MARRGTTGPTVPTEPIVIPPIVIPDLEPGRRDDDGGLGEPARRDDDGGLGEPARRDDSGTTLEPNRR